MANVKFVAPMKGKQTTVVYDGRYTQVNTYNGDSWICCNVLHADVKAELKRQFEVVYPDTVVNGFVFNAIGDLVDKPSTYTMETLEMTYNHLINSGQVISASRINHLIQCYQFS